MNIQPVLEKGGSREITCGGNKFSLVWFCLDLVDLWFLQTCDGTSNYSSPQKKVLGQYSWNAIWISVWWLLKPLLTIFCNLTQRPLSLSYVITIFGSTNPSKNTTTRARCRQFEKWRVKYSFNEYSCQIWWYSAQSFLLMTCVVQKSTFLSVLNCIKTCDYKPQPINVDCCSYEYQWRQGSNEEKLDAWLLTNRGLTNRHRHDTPKTHGIRGQWS